ncbi:hypothetical protein FFI89_003290 [Bradyrhizobium sp. KBS0727]|uniref:hypothetical protein n=1 Tax=unclassified Bradyrhizobium TaxID=2631580 RepID=UPI00110E6F91|nr:MULTISPECIES: hypothetical protein [unclassified Bradyrhizobium]QDW36249.1 hypothetical protein FFI71_003290 [Bradyrhizobium sp. KBS0725]QDW42850.1 hypothetical protein FFI89_003290 [Bradyrhizobium sp. KBS0727]
MSDFVSTGPSVSLFADSSRLGRPEVAPVVRTCIFRVVDVGSEVNKIEPSAGYFILKAGTMQSNISVLAGKQEDPRSEFRTVSVALKWGELAECIYEQDDRELCDPDNRAAMVEATTKFFASAKQIDTSKSGIPASAARTLENLSDKLLNALKNHRHYGTLVAADFSSFAAPEILRVMNQEKQNRDICKR